MRTIGRPGKNIYTLSSHRATRALYAKVPSHRAPVEALCEGSMRAKGALCLMKKKKKTKTTTTTTTKWHPRPAKTQISLGIRPV